MSTDLPVLTRTIDNAFVTTWYEIREEAIDNILDATVISAALVDAGSFVPQVGGEFITRTVRYGEKTAEDLEKGDTLPSGDPELETMARWTWRYFSSHVQRSVFDDQKNNGPSKIKSLVGMKLTAARDALEQRLETTLMRDIRTDESGKGLQSINDIVPPKSDRTAGQYGGINRPSNYISDPQGTGVEIPDPDGTNPWWGPKYLTGTESQKEQDLLTDMKKIYNSVHANQSPPNLIVTTQELFEIYEEFALDISQIMKDENNRLANLGFEVLKFKGKPLIWTPNVDSDNMLFLNTDYVELVYDPQLWFEMTDFKPIPLQPDRIAHIMSAANLISSQLRRHGRLIYE